MSFRRKDKRAIKKDYPASERCKNWKEARKKWIDYYAALRRDGFKRDGRYWLNLLQ